MSWFRTFCLSLIVCLAVWFVQGRGQPASQPAPPTAPAPAVKNARPDPAAKQFLDDAIQLLDRKRLNWVETTLWQQMDAQGVLFQTEGIYLAGPDYRLHMNLKVHLGDSTGKMEIVCDGKTFWEATQLGGGDKKINKVDLKRLEEALKKANAPALWDEYIQAQSFAGVMPLLQSLKQNMTPVQKESVRWNDHDAVKLTAVWSPETVKNIAPTDKHPWPAFLPRQCLIYLDEKTRWPLRLEWWGPSPLRVADSLLLQMEFRNPRFTQMSEERAARVFKFDPGAADVFDRTDLTIQELTARLKKN